MRAFNSLAATVLLWTAVGVTSAETIGYSYDDAGRLVQVHYPDGSIAYEYDPAGNLLSRTVIAGALPSPIEPTMRVARPDSVSCV